MIESTALAPAMPPVAAQGDWNSTPDQETAVDPRLRPLRAACRVPEKSLPVPWRKTAFAIRGLETERPDHPLMNG